jgi:hypothetical protein
MTAPGKTISSQVPVDQPLRNEAMRCLSRLGRAGTSSSVIGTCIFFLQEGQAISLPKARPGASSFVAQ